MHRRSEEHDPERRLRFAEGDARLLRDSTAAARAARLEYCIDGEPGCTRRRRGKGFEYCDPQGRRIRDARVLSRIRALAIPPAWRDVWISPSLATHVQATGRDARGRKQYKDHPSFRALREAAKYLHIARFGRHLPRLRRRIGRDLARPGLDRAKGVAVVLERVSLELGNTVAVCRKSYVHPAVIEHFACGELQRSLGQARALARRKPVRGLRMPEAAAVHWLESL